MQLIETLDDIPASPPPPAQADPAAQAVPTRTGGKWLHVRVTDTNTGKVRVNVRLPINVVSAGLKMGAKFSPEVEGLDMNQLMGFIQSGETGQIADVFDQDDGEHVEVFIE